MNRFVLSLVAVLFFLPLYADSNISEEAIEEQQSDQASCVQRLLTPCIDKCESNQGSNCEQLCKENIENECRDAGE